MAQQNNTSSVYGAFKEMQKLRDKVRMLSEKNVELAKVLTATKQELTKARIAQTNMFSKKVLRWMDESSKNVEVRHQAIQCNLMKFSEGSLTVEKSSQVEENSQLLTCQYREIPRILNMGTEPRRYERGRASPIYQDDNVVEKEATNCGVSPKQDADCLTYAQNTSTVILRNNQFERRHRTNLSNDHFCSGLERGNTETEVVTRLRQRDSRVSYVEPKLNAKLRRGDYYGLGKRPSPSTRHVKKKCAKVKSRRTSSAFGPRSFGQQFSPFRRRRAIPPVSYVEPKINTKLRQGDKFTFTT